MPTHPNTVVYDGLAIGVLFLDARERDQKNFICVYAAILFFETRYGRHNCAFCSSLREMHSVISTRHSCTRCESGDFLRARTW